MQIVRMLARSTLPRQLVVLRSSISGTRLFHGNGHQRFVAAAATATKEARPAASSVDFVRAAIEEMLNNREEDAIKPISDKELHKNLIAFANLFQEARACIQDCAEARQNDSFPEEYETAQGAVDQAFNSYVDLLDDFRRATDSQLKALCQDRVALAYDVRLLRQELAKVGASRSATNCSIR